MMQSRGTPSDFLRFLLGFVAMLSIGFGALVAVGFYQVEWGGDTTSQLEASAR